MLTRLPCALGLATGLSWVSWGDENDGPVLRLECLCRAWPGDIRSCAGEMAGPGFWKLAEAWHSPASRVPSCGTPNAVVAVSFARNDTEDASP